MQAVPWAPCLCPWPWNPASAPEGPSANRRTRRRAAAAQEQTVNTDLEDIFSRFSFPLALELFFSFFGMFVCLVVVVARGVGSG